jgi:hypothetical protein
MLPPTEPLPERKSAFAGAFFFASSPLSRENYANFCKVVVVVAEFMGEA